MNTTTITPSMNQITVTISPALAERLARVGGNKARDQITKKMKHYYAVESIGMNANTNRRHCATYMRFTTESERDEWVNAKNHRTAIKASDSDMRHAARQEQAFWDEQEIGEMLIA